MNLNQFVPRFSARLGPSPLPLMQDPLSDFEKVIRAHVEAAVNIAAVGVCLTALIPYSLHRKSANFVATLLFFISTCTFFSALLVVESLSRLLSFYEVLETWFMSERYASGEWFYICKTSAFNFIYISGTFLALDRVFVILYPARYAIWRLSQRLSVLAIFLSLLFFAVLAGTNLVFPYAPQRKSSFSTQQAQKYVGIIFDVVAPIELLLHVLFCVLYHRFARRTATKQSSAKANQVTLVQSISQIVFCIFPKIWNRIEMNVIGRRIWIMLRVTIYYQLFFSLHILLTCSFIVYKMRVIRRTKVISVVRNSMYSSHKS